MGWGAQGGPGISLTLLFLSAESVRMNGSDLASTMASGPKATEPQAANGRDEKENNPFAEYMWMENEEDFDRQVREGGRGCQLGPSAAGAEATERFPSTGTRNACETRPAPALLRAGSSRAEPSWFCWTCPEGRGVEKVGIKPPPHDAFGPPRSFSEGR